MKKIIWFGQTYEKLLNFPKPVKRLVGYNLDRLQRGMNPIDWKPMTLIGKGVKEIRIQAQNQYRIIYTANVNEGIYVLHAFMKKTQKTNKQDIDIAKQRLKEVLQIVGNEHE